jgi:hypothetical protein
VSDEPLVVGNLISAGHIQTPDEPGTVLPYSMLVQFSSVDEFKAAQKAKRFAIEWFSREPIIENWGEAEGGAQ